ncbi:MAG: hypothetical protein L6R35_005417 [Caloplaca aegaea]|nr:MAG: hypothetical protein L6R35_005417 [Caloplaca aegaea]
MKNVGLWTPAFVPVPHTHDPAIEHMVENQPIRISPDVVGWFDMRRGMMGALVG